PLTGASGVVEIAFRFRSLPNGGGLGWWIDDVAVNGDAACATTGVNLIPFSADYDASGARIVLRWDLGSIAVAAVGIERAAGGGPRTRVATLADPVGAGLWEDTDVSPGRTQDYWLVVPREGGGQDEYGPVEVVVPAGRSA